MPHNFWLQKRRTDVTPDPFTASQGLREWLTPEAVLRVLFFGAARRDLAIGVTYVPFDPEEDAFPTCGASARLLRAHGPAHRPARLLGAVHVACSSTRAPWSAAGTRRPSGRGAASSS